jgi:hypothetical protein
MARLCVIWEKRGGVLNFGLREMEDHHQC